MPEIQAFRGLRYDLGHVGSLSDVIAPPYDVIDPALQDELYKKHPANVIRLELNRDEPGDDENHNRYTRAAKFFKNWQSEGVLQLDPQAAVYVYHQTFEYAGLMHTRRGFMCRVKLERFGEGKIYPHEETHASAKADRLKLTTACQANLSQIFGLYPDPENEAQELLEAATIGVTPLEATDHLGVVHRLWVVTDLQIVNKVSAVVNAKPMFIADGHHRYETACNYRDELAKAGKLTPHHPANFVLTQCVSMNDPGLVVLPTHRLFRGLPELSSTELADKLRDYFDLTPAGTKPADAKAIWKQIETDGDQSQMAFYTTKDGQWTLARLNAAGEAKMAEISTDHSAEWQGLGVAILHRLAIDTLLGAKNLPKARYVHLVEEAVEGLEQGDVIGEGATGGKFPLGCLVMPATIDHIQAVSEHHERMPAKSTYFYPKLLSGMVFHLLE
ncbi:MAG TPA: DUF1015 domain-containing protein [Pirellulaceae bacterium]|nr:DUF1015 domain-containing protein [Pirellulaceae bacterium]